MIGVKGMDELTRTDGLPVRIYDRKEIQERARIWNIHLVAVMMPSARVDSPTKEQT